MIKFANPILPNILEFFYYMLKIWKSRIVSNNGTFHSQLEEMLKNYLAAKHIVLYSNGHLALEAAIDALDLSGEVITTPFTFASTTQAILRRGLKPVFCDINFENYTIDVDKIETLITDKTTAIIPVHVYGNVCDVDRIQQIADKHNLKVIYDAAHSFGVMYRNKPICNFGDASMLSFHATKVFNTLEGGAVIFQEENLREKLNSLKNFGIDHNGEISFIGGNAKMNELQSLVGILNLRKINREIKKREYVFKSYQENFKNLLGIRVIEENINIRSNFSYYSILITKEDKCPIDLISYLNHRGIIAKRYFHPLTTDIKGVNSKIEYVDIPVAKYVSDRVVALPIYGDLARKEVKKIIGSVKEYINL